MGKNEKERTRLETTFCNAYIFHITSNGAQWNDPMSVDILESDYMSHISLWGHYDNITSNGILFGETLMFFKDEEKQNS